MADVHDDLDDAGDFWDRVAVDWEIQVGDEGDDNWRLSSDPVLWRFVREVDGLDVLDAGCGTGYRSSRLPCCGAGPVFAAWPFAPGTSGHYATTQSPSCSKTAVNSLCMAYPRGPTELVQV
jgi:hypothetical protein